MSTRIAVLDWTAGAKVSLDKTSTHWSLRTRARHQQEDRELTIELRVKFDYSDDTCQGRYFLWQEGRDEMELLANDEHWQRVTDIIERADISEDAARESVDKCTCSERCARAVFGSFFTEEKEDLKRRFEALQLIVSPAINLG